MRCVPGTWFSYFKTNLDPLQFFVSEFETVLILTQLNKYFVSTEKTTVPMIKLALDALPLALGNGVL